MIQKDDSMKKALASIKQESVPTEQQKERMLGNILAACEDENVSGFVWFKKTVITYPWRVAFAVSAAQAVILTIIFGTQYTNLFLSFFGG